MNEANGTAECREYVGSWARVVRDADTPDSTSRPPVAKEDRMKAAAKKPHLTDFGNAERFEAMHGHKVRFVHDWGRWLLWTGTHWQTDRKRHVQELAKDTVRAMYKEAAVCTKKEDRKELAGHALRSETAYRLRSTLELAKSVGRIPVGPEELDMDVWLLNCTNGTVDLRTGELRPHRHEDMITKLCPTKYDPTVKAPRFLDFLNEIFEGGSAIIEFIQRAAGYSLTGVIREHCLFILHGSGANGKTTLVEAIAAALGDDYAQRAPVELLLKKRSGSIPTDVARLRGSRFVSAQEVDQGCMIAESLVKTLTGGDKVTARLLYRDYFEFAPTHKLFLCTNHRPEIRGTDHAIWRRIKLVPFTVTIPPEEQDLGLLDKLKREAPGILAWAVKGCLLWQQVGLREPTEVSEATQEYRREQDTLAEFLAQCCVQEKTAEVRAGELHAAYRGWCVANGVEPLSAVRLSHSLADRGFAKNEDREGRFYVGIGLLDEEVTHAQ